MIVPYRLALSDLTSSVNINLNDNIQFANPRFAPELAVRKRSPLASGGPYQPVLQPILIDVLGDTPTRCWANLATLIDTLDQADRWRNDDLPVNQIYLLYQATATAPTVQSEIWGYQGDDTAYDIDDTFALYKGRYAIRDVQLSVVRMGLWEAASTELLTSGTGTNPAILSATSTNSPNVPSRYRFAGVVPSSLGFNRRNNYAFLLLTSDSNKLQLIDSTTFQTPVGTSNQADAANNPLGGTVKRWQANTTALRSLALINVAGWTTLKRRVGIFAAVRNNSATTSFFVQGEMHDTAAPLAPVQARPVEVPPTSTLPQIVPLGTLSSRWDISPAYYVALNISASQTNAAQTLDVDYVALICLDDTITDRVIATGNAITTTGGDTNLTIESGAFFATPSPTVQSVTATDIFNEPYRGDPYVLSTGTQIAALMLTTNGDNYWRVGGASAYTHQFTARRRLAYRTPPGS